MATAKNQKPKKVGRPSNKEIVTENKSDKKTTEKKTVKKIILTSEKTPEQELAELENRSAELRKKIEEKTKKTEVVSQAISVEEAIKNTPVSGTITTPTNTTITSPPVVKEEPKTITPKPVAQNDGNSIVPVDDDEDEIIKNNIMGDVKANTNNAQKVYTFNKGMEFMEGHLKIGIDGTNISRRNETIFDIFGKSEHGADFKTEFECIDKEEGDFLITQLNEGEKNPALYYKAPVEPVTTPANTTPTTTETAAPPANQIPDLTKSHALDANGNIDMTKLSLEEIKSIQTGNMNKAPVQEKKVQDFSGIPLTSVNIDEMINNLPPKPEHQNINTGNNPALNSTSSSVDITNILHSQSLSQIKTYAQSIGDSINNSFQANVWGAMPQNDVRLFFKNCDGQYLYELLNDENGFYLNVKRDNISVRVPENPTEYLKVK